jgi:arylsulfatase A-like enzyme
MRFMKNIFISIISALLLAACNQPPKQASETSGKTNNASGEIDRTFLPIKVPDAPTFTELDARNVKAPARFEVKTPKEAPNVLIILLDDFGYGDPSTFGGPIPMPTADRLAADGLRYTRFHTTAMCAPTRAALLTGRNHHSVNMGTITEMSTSMPGYTGVRPQDVATMAEMLKLNGYNTAHFGKTHEVPTWEYSVVGNYDNWPTQSGMEYFYGFFGGETDQWNPSNLYEGQAKIPCPSRPGYHFMKDMTDHAISYLRQQKTLAPDKPFFVYFAPGATHAPHHAPKEWIEKFKGKFDDGWDKMREETLERQKKLNIVPANTKLAPKPKDIKNWDALSAEEKKLFAHQMEVFAGYAAYADYEVGQLIDAIDSLGQLDNTLIFYIMGDNGASGEGRMHGLFNEMTIANGIDEPIEMQLKNMEKLGGPEANNHYAAGWAVAGDAPFAWVKQVAANFGGTRNGLVVHWPKGIKAKGEIRTQFHDVIDVTPTILEAAQLPQPKEVNGFKQHPIEGTSMVYSFNEAKANDRHITQYFEINANRGIYHDGWFAGTIHLIPWIPRTSPVPLTEDKWELYNINEDFSLSNDLSASNAGKLKELQDLFLTEGAKYRVLPIDSRYVERFNASIAGRPEIMGERTSMTLYQDMSFPGPDALLNVKNKSFSITADVDIPPGKIPSGVILANGGVTGGYVLYVKNGKPIFEWNTATVYRQSVASTQGIPPGRHIVKAVFQYDGNGMGKGGSILLYMDDKKIGEGRILSTPAYAYSMDGLDCGMDLASTVSANYSQGDANRFNGKISKVEINVLK